MPPPRMPPPLTRPPIRPPLYAADALPATEYTAMAAAAAAATAWPSRMCGASGARRTGVDGRSGRLTRRASTAAQDSATTMHAARMVRE